MKLIRQQAAYIEETGGQRAARRNQKASQLVTWRNGENVSASQRGDVKAASWRARKKILKTSGEK